MTTASYLPEFKIGSQQNVNEQDGAEVAGEALEMPEIRRGELACTVIKLRRLEENSCFGLELL